jgi:transglutaminase-like putative cysteine protease
VTGARASDTAGAVAFRVTHRTAYRYSSTVTDAYTVANLLPRATDRQRVVSSSVTTDPLADEVEERTDMLGNHVVQLGLHRPHDAFEIVAASEVILEPADVPVTTASWEDVALRTRSLRDAAAIEIGPFLALTAAVVPVRSAADLDVLVAPDFAPGRPIVEVVRAVCTRIHGEFAFDPAFTDVTTPLDDVIDARRGVCQDFAHLTIGIFRRRGIAARYVSGYLETDPPPGSDRLVGADASHAWCAVWIPDHGWLDLDPTNDQVAPDRHITVAWGLDYGDVAPVRGVVIGPSAAQSLTVEVDVERL